MSEAIRGQQKQFHNPMRPWLDMDTDIEIMPAQVNSNNGHCAEPHDTTVTFVQSETTDDI